MPDIYSIHCVNCDGVVKPEQPGHIFSPWSQAVLNDAGQVVDLCHPLEHAVLRREGLTWQEARRQKRLLEVNCLVCADCGTLVERFTVDYFPPGGCLIISVLCGALAAFLLPGSSWRIGIEVALVAAFTYSFVLRKLFSKLYPHRLAHFNTDKCPRCGSRELLSARSAAREPLTCGRCGQRTLVVRHFGIS